MSVIIAVVLILVLIKVCSKLTLGRCKSPVCLIGKTALITGGNSGIGYETALALAARGCRIIIADKDNCEESKEKIIRETNNSNIAIKHFDLSSLKSVWKLAKDINDTEGRLDILINNAGTSGLGNTYTEDGLHIGMQVNHFGSFLLTHLLVGLLKKSAPSRIIFVSSFAAFFANLTEKNLNSFAKLPTYALSEFITYSNSKLCNTITANGFAKKLEGTGVTSNSLYPGVVNTPMIRKYAYCVGNSTSQKNVIYFILACIVKVVAKNAEEGAQTTLHLALAKEVQNVTGKFFLDCTSFMTPSSAKNQYFSSQIWKASEEYVKLSPDEKL